MLGTLAFVTMFSIVFCSPIRHTRSGVHLSMDLVAVDGDFVAVDDDFVECCEWPVIDGVEKSRCPPGMFCSGICPPGGCCGIPDATQCASYEDQCCPTSAMCCDSYCCRSDNGEKCCGGAEDDGGCCLESETCAVNSQQKKTCCEDENLCTDDSQSQSGDLMCCTNTDDDYCDLGEPGVIPPSCSFLRACIWDYPECEVSEPLSALPLVDSSILQILISSMCDTNFDPNKCTEIIGTDCKKVIPAGWLHTTNPSCQNQTTQPQVLPTELTTGQIYRVLRVDEIAASQVFAKDPAAEYTVGGHVTQGDRLLTQYISASTDFYTNYAYCRKYYDIGRKIIVVLDVAILLQNGCRVLEVSKGEGIKATNKRALNFARSQDEVLIVGPPLPGRENVYTACTAANTQGAVIAPIECISHLPGENSS